MADGGETKYKLIFEDLQRGIREGMYPHGVSLPSDEALMRRYGVSRITATKAMAELVRHGLVYRKRGSGTFATRAASRDSGRLGLIMPSLSFGEIFPPICQSLMRCAQGDGYVLQLGDVSSGTPRGRALEANRVAQSFVAQGVAGVIIQPLAFLHRPEQHTQKILELFDEAEIPVVLLDRDIDTKDAATCHDFVGIDNIAAGRAVGLHLLERGAKRICFLMRPNCATVIMDRFVGVRSAAMDSAAEVRAVTADPAKASALAPLFKGENPPDAVVCESDYVAATFSRTLMKLGVRVPDDVMLSGFDDVNYATTMSPSLTTVHQPCADLAKIAYRTLRERMADATLPPRRILLPAPLVVRESTNKR